MFDLRDLIIFLLRFLCIISLVLVIAAVLYGCVKGGIPEEVYFECHNCHSTWMEYMYRGQEIEVCCPVCGGRNG